MLLIQPGFPVQTTQCDVIGLKHVGLDIHGYRGEALIKKLDEIMSEGNINSIVYSNPNNPSWVCFTEEELKGIGELADKHDVIVLEDLAYFAMDFRRDLSHPYQAPYQATVGKYTDNYVLWVSGSKAFSYAGQRIGVTCISNKLYHRVYEPLQKNFGVGEFGNFLCNRLMYTLSSGTTHSVQHAMAALMEAACNGSYNFLDDVKEYGRRAKFMKDVLLANGFWCSSCRRFLLHRAVSWNDRPRSYQGTHVLWHRGLSSRHYGLYSAGRPRLHFFLPDGAGRHVQGANRGICKGAEVMTLLERLNTADRFASGIGAQLVEVREGYARAELTVEDRHLNAAGVCQGGVIYTLADLAFAGVCNSHGTLTLGVNTSISFMKSAQLGEKIIAEATEVLDHHKLPYCDIRVRNEQGEVLAGMTGLGYRTRKDYEFDALM